MEIKMIKHENKWLLLQIKGKDNVEIKIVDTFENRAEALKKIRLYKFVLRTSADEFKKITEEIKDDRS